MAFEPTVIATGDYNIARRPALGGELEVYLSSSEVVGVGSFEQSAADVGVWTADTVNAAILSADPSDLVLKVVGEAKSGVNIVMTVSGTDQNDAALGGTATVKPPAWVVNQTKDFPEGYAVDVVPGTVSKRFKTITAVYVVGGSRGAAYSLFKMPADASWNRVGCINNEDFTTKSRPAKPIACGMDGSAYVKQGRSEPGTLTVTAKYISFADGLQRFTGRRCSVKAVLKKEKQVVTEVMVFGNYVPNVRPTFPDGDEDVSGQVEGMYEEFFLFAAK